VADFFFEFRESIKRLNKGHVQAIENWRKVVLMRTCPWKLTWDFIIKSKTLLLIISVK